MGNQAAAVGPDRPAPAHRAGAEIAPAEKAQGGQGANQAQDPPRRTDGRGHCGSRAARARLGYLAELFRFPGWYTADEVLALHQRLSGSDGGAAERRRLLELVALGHRQLVDRSERLELPDQRLLAGLQLPDVFGGRRGRRQRSGPDFATPEGDHRRDVEAVA